METYAREHGPTLTQLALAYLLAQPLVSVPVIGATSLEQLSASLGAAEWQLTAEEAARVRGLAG